MNEANQQSGAPSSKNSSEYLTKRDLGDCVKQAFGDLKDYFDNSLHKQKVDSDKQLQSTSQQVAELKRATELQFKYKGNKTQYVFNSEIQEKLILIEELLADGRETEVQAEIEKAVAALKKRNKHIRLADKSEGGLFSIFC